MVEQDHKIIQFPNPKERIIKEAFDVLFGRNHRISKDTAVQNLLDLLENLESVEPQPDK